MYKSKKKTADALLRAIKSGDKEHQQWLKEKVYKFYNINKICKKTKTKTSVPTCPNCKKRWVFEESDDKEYAFLLTHRSSTCPFGLLTYQYTKQKCIDSANSFLDDKFPWRNS